MERYILLVSLTEHSPQVRQIINILLERLKIISNNFLHLNLSMVKFTHAYVGGSPLWLTIDELSNNFTQELESKNENVWEDENIIIEKMKMVAENINFLADSLPTTGSFLFDVLWFWDFSETPFQISKNLEFFGCIKRLVLWHNAQVNLIVSEVDEEYSAGNEWSQHLNASIMKVSNLMENLTVQDEWRGNISISKDVTLKGFSLLHFKPPKVNQVGKHGDSQRICFSTQLEVVAMCQKDSLTPFLLTNDRFSLKIIGNHFNSDSSRKWIQYLEANNLAVFLRLNYCNEDTLPDSVCNFSTTTLNWKEHILKGNFISFPSLKKNCECLTLLLITGEQTKNNDDRIVFSIDLNKINGSVGYHLSNQQQHLYSQPQDIFDKNIDILFRELPVFNKETFQKILSFIIEAQGDIVNFWKDEISVEEKKSSLANPNELQIAIETLIRNIIEYVSSMTVKFADVPSVKTGMKESVFSNDYLMDPENWRERKALFQWEDETNRNIVSPKKTFSGLFPLSNEKIGLIDWKNISNYFNKNGEALKNYTSKNFKKSFISHPRCVVHPNIEETNLKFLNWPEIKYCCCPDVYSMMDTEAENSRSQLNLEQIKEKHILQETLSLFVVSDLKKEKDLFHFSTEDKSKTLFPTKKKYDNLRKSVKNIVDCSPLRRSPRKRIKTEHFSYPYKENTAKESQTSNKTEISLNIKSSTKSGYEKVLPRRSPRKHDKKVKSEWNSSSTLRVVSDEQNKSKNILNSKMMQNDEMSERHKKKLRAVIADTLEKHGIDIKHELFLDCGRRLFNLCKMFLKDVIGQGKTSDHMRNIAKDHVKQTIEFFAKMHAKNNHKKKK